MTDLSLDRDLWRFQYGALAPELLETRLRAAVQQLAAQRVHVGTRRTCLERWTNGALLVLHAQAFDEALRAVNTLRFRDALRAIHRCREIGATVEEITQADRDIRAAEDVLERANVKIGLPLLRQLPALAAMEQTVQQARECMSMDRPREASGLASVCTRLGRALLATESSNDVKSGEVLARLAALEDLHRATSALAMPPDDEIPAALVILRNQMKDGHTVLAGRLCAELQMQLAGRKRFLDFLERRRRTGSPANATDEDLRASVAQRSWDGTVEHYWHQSIAQYTTVLTRTRAEVKAAADEITHLLTSGE